MGSSSSYLKLIIRFDLGLMFLLCCLLWLICSSEGILVPADALRSILRWISQGSDQMPALKMKTNSATFSSKEKNLHVSPKSTLISKSSLSLAKSVQYVEEVAGSIQSHSVTKRLQDSAVLTCTSNSDSIFSPILESADACSASNAPNDGGRDNLYIPQLETEDSDSSKSSSEYQMCNVSDFYISEMIVSCLPIEGDPLDDDESLTARFLSDYKCKEPDILTNVDEAVIQSDDSSLYMAIHQLRSFEKSDTSTCSEADQADSFDPLIFIRNLPEISERPIMLPKESQRNKLTTLVLDLDETLVHSTLEHRDDADFTFPVFLNMKEHVVYVKQRPHLKTFLQRVAEMFEIVIFTASQSIYASQLLDILDPDGKLIARRAYRESCIFSDGCYTKDLTVLGVDLAKVVIIDNTPQVFRLQVNNGIPIKSWFDDPSDSALISLLPFLERLADADDVRPIIAKNFGNKEHESLVSSP